MKVVRVSLMAPGINVSRAAKTIQSRGKGYRWDFDEF
jgi:hypothetical protein